MSKSKKKAPKNGIFDCPMGIPSKSIETNPEVETLRKTERRKIVKSAKALEKKMPHTIHYIHGFEWSQSIESIIKKSEKRLEELNAFDFSVPTVVPFLPGDEPKEYREQIKIGSQWVMLKKPKDLNPMDRAEVGEHLKVLKRGWAILDGLDLMRKQGATNSTIETFENVIATARMLGLHEGRAAAYKTETVQDRRNRNDKLKPKEKTVSDDQIRKVINNGSYETRQKQADELGIEKRTLQGRLSDMRKRGEIS